MSQHLDRAIHVGYSPSCDIKWKPEYMDVGKFYPVYGYENGTLKLKPKPGAASNAPAVTGEAFYFHVIGNGCRPCRLISSNAVVVLDSEIGAGSDEKKLWETIAAYRGGAPAAGRPADDPGF